MPERVIPPDVKRAINDLRCAARKLCAWFDRHREPGASLALSEQIEETTEAFNELKREITGKIAPVVRRDGDAA